MSQKSDLKDVYISFHATNQDLYKARTDTLLRESKICFDEYVENKSALFIAFTGRRIKLKDIRDELMWACKNGVNFVEYIIHKHLYPGYKGDNISFLSGMYYIYEERNFIMIPGAPSLVNVLREQIPEAVVTYRNDGGEFGTLRIELR